MNDKIGKEFEITGRGDLAMTHKEIVGRICKLDKIAKSGLAVVTVDGIKGTHSIPQSNLIELEPLLNAWSDAIKNNEISKAHDFSGGFTYMNRSRKLSVSIRRAPDLFNRIKLMIKDHYLKSNEDNDE